MELVSKTVSLRLITEDDAEFVLKLRTDSKYNQFLSAVSSDVEQQKSWIRNYKADEKAGNQYYFIIQRNDGVPCGTVRIYDIKDDSFGWGSWILNEDKTRFAALESAFLVYKFGFEELKFSKSHFEVRKDNSKVVSFHEKMGAVRTSETEQDVFLEITKDAVAHSRERLIGKI